MRIYVMTDIEGVAGVLDWTDWGLRESRYLDLGRELLTKEVNAAIDGFMAGGATDIVVSDGYYCGGINPLLLDERAEMLRHWPTGWPLLLDGTYDALAFVGQHAKSGTEYAHLAHTQSCTYLDLSINGVSIGELGQLALCAGELGVPVIFCSGDRALCQEAQALLPGVETVAVKRGTAPGRGDEMDYESYNERNISAIHMHPERARAAIRAGAERAARRAMNEEFVPLRLAPPYELVAHFRAKEERPPSIATNRHPSSIAALLNLPLDRQPVTVPETGVAQP
ncbi:MAG: M55 family metallopeptidase [Anaerolineae bacterium]